MPPGTPTATPLMPRPGQRRHCRTATATESATLAVERVQQRLVLFLGAHGDTDKIGNTSRAGKMANDDAMFAQRCRHVRTTQRYVPGKNKIRRRRQHLEATLLQRLAQAFATGNHARTGIA